MAALDANVIEVIVVEPTQFANRRVQPPFSSDPATDSVQRLADEDQRREKRAGGVILIDSNHGFRLPIQFPCISSHRAPPDGVGQIVSWMLETSYGTP